MGGFRLLAQGGPMPGYAVRRRAKLGGEENLAVLHLKCCLFEDRFRGVIIVQ